MSIAGCAGIAAGRLSSFFDTSNRGNVIDSVFFSQWVQPVKNTVTGIIEYRFATFLLQSVIAGILFVALALFDRKCKLRKDGDVTLLFCLLYCSSQFVLDSTRYDSMKMHSNGFISMVQIASMLTIIIVIVIVMMRLTRRCGFKLNYLMAWGMILALLGCAGFMEYYVQRYSNRSAFAYSVMSVSLLCVCIITILAYFKQLKRSTLGR
jgi:prolipoprotein diacylglyceryltransferase